MNLLVIPICFTIFSDRLLADILDNGSSFLDDDEPEEEEYEYEAPEDDYGMPEPPLRKGSLKAADDEIPFE